MLDVNIEKILPVTEVRDSLNKIIDEVESTDELYVITKNGKPSAIIVGVHHLEKLTGIKHDDLMPETSEVSEASTSSSSSALAQTTASAATAQDDSTDDLAPASPIIGSVPDQSFKIPETNQAAPTTGSAFESPAVNGTKDLFTSPAPIAAPPATEPSETPSTNTGALATDAVDDAGDDIFGPEEPETPAAATSSATPAEPVAIAETPAAMPGSSATATPVTPTTPPAQV